MKVFEALDEIPTRGTIRIGPTISGHNTNQNEFLCASHYFH